MMQFHLRNCCCGGPETFLCTNSSHSVQSPAQVSRLGFLVGIRLVSGSCGDIWIHQEASKSDVLGMVAVGAKAIPLVGVEPDCVSRFQRQHQALALESFLSLAVIIDHRLHLQVILHQLDGECFLRHLAHIEREVIRARNAAGEHALGHVEVFPDVDKCRVEADRLVMR